MSLIDDLQNCSAFPDDTTEISVVQTHISVVFIGDEFVYKIKKPVNFGFLDFSTLEKRKYFCHQEVKLNRRLAKDIYIGVLPVMFDGKRHFLGRGQGDVVEYAVKMKRIPEEKLMKSVFKAGGLTTECLKRIAVALSTFHLSTLTNPKISEFGTPEKFKINTDENFQQVEKYIGVTIPKNEFYTLKGWTEAFYRENRDLLMSRIETGRIRDCHGDLHMEHICLTDDLSIIDCIEFNDRFRYSDTVADIAFLLMDLEYHGGRDKSEILWKQYKDLAEEKDGVDSLLKFYKAYRAFVRGKVISFQIDDEGIGEREKKDAVKKASDYFRLACSYAEIT